jgi:predicted NAD/FAD-binding protein
MVYTHPIYTPESLSSQVEINKFIGQRNTHYCGSYLGYGFHEDAVKSSVAVARSLGIEL